MENGNTLPYRSLICVSSIMRGFPSWPGMAEHRVADGPRLMGQNFVDAGSKIPPRIETDEDGYRDFGMR
jgi:hypothetical protein